MERLSGAVISVLALLFGFVAAPHTHVHQPADVPFEGHHSHDATVVHAHVTPHSHPNQHSELPAQHEDDDVAGRTWSVDGFVFQPAAFAHAPVPVLLPELIPYLDASSGRHGVWRLRPNAHGPPPVTGSDLRAPPAFPPAFI